MITPHLIFRFLLSILVSLNIVKFPTLVSGACVPLANANVNNGKVNGSNNASIKHLEISTSSAAGSSKQCYFVTFSGDTNYKYTYNTSIRLNFNNTSNGNSSNKVKTMTLARFGKLRLFKNFDVQKQEEKLPRSSTSLSKASSILTKPSWWSSLTSSWWKFGRSETPTASSIAINESSKQQTRNMANENAFMKESGGATAAPSQLKERKTFVGIATSEISSPVPIHNLAKKVTKESNTYKINTAKFNTKEPDLQLETENDAKYHTQLTVKASMATPTTKLGTHYQQTKADQSAPRPVTTDYATDKPQTDIVSIILISSKNKNTGSTKTLTNTNSFPQFIETSPKTAEPHNANNNSKNNNAEQNAKYNLLIEQGNIVLGVLGVVEGVVGFASGMLTTSYTTIQSTVTRYTVDPLLLTEQLVLVTTSCSDEANAGSNTSTSNTNEVWNTLTTTEVVYRTISVS